MFNEIRILQMFQYVFVSQLLLIDSIFFKKKQLDSF